MDKEKMQKGQVNIELPEDVAEGIYANLAVIAHSQSEFIVDFVNVMPGVPKAKVKSRIILTPQHTKRLFHALKENLMKFENMYGDINVPENMDLPFTLGGPKGEA